MSTNSARPIDEEMPSARTAQLGDIRRRNLSLLMRTLLEHGPIARSELASLTGITSGGVTKLVAVLAEAGMIKERFGDTAPERSGRPRVPISIDTTRYYVIGVHIGYPRTTLGVLDLGGQLVHEIGIPHTSLDPPSVLDNAVRAARGLVRDADATVLTVGASTPGQVDPASGVVGEQPFLNWHDVPLRDWLSDSLGLPVSVDSNIRALARAEHWFGAAKGLENFVQLFVGNVVSAAWVVQGRVVRGARGMAGDVAHLSVDENSTKRCHCGRRDCLQLAATDAALVTKARTGKIIKRSQRIDALLDSARTKGSAADALVTRRAELVGEAAVLLLDLLDPQRLVLSGGGLLGRADSMNDILRGARRRAGRRSRHDLRGVLSPTAFGGSAIAISAGAIALDTLYRDPLAFAGRPRLR